ncbi:NAD(P)-dependent oxidoreductase [Rhizobium sp. CG5]|uniref:NAD(P)-dependent oxidoreductase n=1 Tax=Rhizobium sp. CG5 TaxID=2726076 RepID=UPI002033699C|nr:NAD(P)-dependent oxidoreductase [Rhizobium sp. CG5]MCM2476390.1 NAD(P)-dependent oxidoreductase [Rhizobium sp. CG5]
MTKEHIGFIGVGLMGHGMAKNLLAKGWPLTVMGHRNRAPVDNLVSLGAGEAKTPREMAEVVDVVILCVTGSAQVQAVIDGPDGLRAAGRPLLVIDCSTSDPSITMALAERLALDGITLMDAPLGRTPTEAEAGTLDVMAGGDNATFARAAPILAAFSDRIIHTGPTGSGHTTKLLNNFLALGYAALYAEALMIGAKTGISAKTFDGVIRGGRMDCGFYQTFAKWFVEGDPDAHKFTISNALKDVTYLASLGNALGVANPVGTAVRNSYSLACGLGHGAAYVPRLVDIISASNRG